MSALDTYCETIPSVERLACPTKPLGRRRSSRAFTLVELLVVVAIIGILIALLLPAIGSALAKGKAAACKANLRQVGQAVAAFATMYRDTVPGTTGAVSNQVWQKEWLGIEVNKPGRSVGISTYGTISSMLGVTNESARQLYRCPGHNEGRWGSGNGSNGLFDYALIPAFSGVKLSLIPSNATLYQGLGAARELQVPTPLVVEEDPKYFINASTIKPSFTGTDRLGSWHRDQGFYVAVDGSVFGVKKKDATGGPEASDWKIRNENNYSDWIPINTPPVYGAWKPYR